MFKYHGQRICSDKHRDGIVNIRAVSDDPDSVPSIGGAVNGSIESHHAVLNFHIGRSRETIHNHPFCVLGIEIHRLDRFTGS